MSVIVELFKKAQFGDASQAQLSTKLLHAFHRMDVDEFSADFISCLKAAFKSSADLNARVDQIIEFSVSFIVSAADLNSSDAVDDAENELRSNEDVTRLMYDIFDFFKQSHRSTLLLIRKRICQFVAKLFVSLGADALLDCFICDTIVDIMCQRLKDKVPVIRIQAVLAVFRLQDRGDKNCRVTKTLLECIETDSCADVRKLALSKLCVSQKWHVRVIMDRINDVSEKVRAEAYVVLSKLHLKQLTIEERKRLLRTGLYDNNENVRNTVKNVLLPAWLNRMDQDILNLLKALDVDIESTNVMIKMLMALFKSCSDEMLAATFRRCTDDDSGMNVISYDKLGSESGLFWHCYVLYSSPSEMVNEKDDYKWDAKLSFDVVQASLLPDLSVFCEYIATYYDSITETRTENLWDKREREFVLIRLIELCKIYDYSDELGRKKLIALCLDLLKRVQVESIKPVLELYFALQTNLDKSVSKVVEIINDLLHPPFDCHAGGNNQHITDSKESEPSTTKSRDASNDQHIKYKVAQLEVRLDELSERRDEAVTVEDYEKAGSLKREISVLRDEIKRLEEELSEKRVQTSCQDDVIDEDIFAEEMDQEDVASPLEGVNVENVERCLLILQEMLNLSALKRLTPALRTLFQLLVLPACKSPGSFIAPLATEVLGSFCLRDKLLAREYFTTFFALYNDSGDVGLSALKVVFDLLLRFGPETFNISSLNEYETTEGTPQRQLDSNSSSSSDSIASSISNIYIDEANGDPTALPTTISGYTFVSVLIDLLDDECEEGRTVVIHGLCKLMATGKLKSVKVLTRLVLIWFHPSYRQSIKIRDCLNFFFPFFVKRCPWATSLFENAFVPIVLKFLNAPPQSPLRETDPKLVIKVLCDILSPAFVSETGNGEESSINGSLAVAMCNTIIDSKNVDHQAVFLKGLLYLDFSLTDESVLTTLANLARKIIKKLKKKHYKKLLVDAEKFKMKVDASR